MALRPHQDFRGFAGQIASGSIAPGEEIVALPSGKTSRVRKISIYGGELTEASAGDSVVIVLEDELDVSRGDMLVRRHNLPQVASRFECILCWMNEEPLNPEGTYLLQHTTRQVRARISELNYRIDVDTLHREPAPTLQLNEIGRVQLTTSQPLFFDPYRINRATGGFILIDPYTNNTVAAGMIRSQAQELDDIAPRTPERPKSSNVVWESTAIMRAAREERNGHQAAMLWFTGLSGSGKTTVARLLERRLFTVGAQTFYLDGDNVRHGLNGDLGFSAADRQENIRRVAEVARLAFDHGAIVICTFISPFARDRAFARSLLPEGRFIEVFTKCDLELCRRRDPKGLYAKALRGEIQEFTGISSPYEEPEDPKLVIDTAVMSLEESVDAIVRLLKEHGIVPEN
jgi:bifunctional enzyme CysN/CysC